MSAGDNSVVGKLEQALVEGGVHLLRCALEEAAAARDEQSVSANQTNKLSRGMAQGGVQTFYLPGEDVALVLFLVLYEVADVVLSVARGVDRLDVQVANLELVLVLELQCDQGKLVVLPN